MKTPLRRASISTALLIGLSNFPAMSQTISPDPLQCLDGTRVRDAQTWRDKRRPELLRLFQEEIYGVTPIGKPENLRFEVRETKADAREGRATRLRVSVLFEGTENGRQMELLI